MGRAKLNKSKSGGDLYKEMGKKQPNKSLEKKINPLKKSNKSNRSLNKSAKSKKKETVEKK